jgi:hypothetical protein
LPADAGVGRDATDGPTGKTYYIAPGGDNANSCTQATTLGKPKRNIMGMSGGLACLQEPGDKVVLRQGIYEERVTLVAPLPSGSSWSSAFTVAAYPGETVVVRGIEVATHDGAHPLSYWIFDGLHSVQSIPGPAAISVEGADHIRFTNMEATTLGAQNPVDCIQGSGAFAEFLNVEVHDCGDPNSGPCGGSCPNGIAWSGADALFEGLKVHDVTGEGIQIYASVCGSPGAPSCPDRNVVRYSEIYGARSSGVFVTHDRNAAYGNLLRANGKGISLDYGATNTQIIQNTIYGNQYDAVTIGLANGCTGTTVHNNILANNGVSGVFNGSGSMATTIKDNLFFGNPAGPIRDLGTGTQASNNPELDPRFQDTSANDLHLKAGSPGIDAATCVPEVPLALDGVMRPLGARCDLGAYEQ